MRQAAKYNQHLRWELFHKYNQNLRD